MRFDLFSLAGRNALVTGGSAGIGLAMTRALASSGARVMIAGRGVERLAQAAEALRGEVPGADILTHAVDLQRHDEVLALADAAGEALGGVDILVGNAGAVFPEPFGALTPEGAAQALQLNLLCNVALVDRLLPHMKAQKWGRFLFSSSTAAQLAAPFRSNILYASAKAGLNAFARALAVDCGRHGITANTIALGVFRTEILADAEAEIRAMRGDAIADTLIEDFTQMTALGRLGRAGDVEGLVRLLASDAGGYITGTSIPVDGGTSIVMMPVRAEPGG